MEKSRKIHENEDIKNELKSDQQVLINELARYGSHLSKNKKHYSCCHCNSSDALSIKQTDNGYMYNCFSCNTGGDVIKLVENQEGVKFQEALKILCDRYNIDYIKPKKQSNPGVNKDKLIDYYKEKSERELKKGNLDEAYENRMKVHDIEEQSYKFVFPYLDAKNNPLKIWENVEALLEAREIKVAYNIIEKDINVLNLNDEDFNSQILDIHSICNQVGFRISIDFLVKAVNRIAMKNKYNPVKEYLEDCEAFYDDTQESTIKQVADCLITNNFDENLKYKLLEKWLLNTANIVYNRGYSNTEGCLVLQGPQGCGKTSFIKAIIPPKFLKTGLDLNPSETDSIRKCIKYWVVELGELDSTMKSDQAKLKAFITESIDEYRIPYSISPVRYNRTTSFFGTVNKSNFLKDETGDRRYWVIPIEEVNLNRLRKININQLWGEVMSLLPYNLNYLNLNKEELKELSESNKEFRVKGSTQIKIETGFLWNEPKENWIVVSSSEIASKLGLTSTSGLREALENCGAEYKRNKKQRGYLVPSFVYDQY